MAIIERLRKEGNFEHNRMYEDEPIVTRRSRKGPLKSKRHFLSCPSCKGYYSKRSLKTHYRLCSKEQTRGLLRKARRITQSVHPSACKLLKDEVIPVMRDGEVKETVRNDKLAVIYGNKLCDKYISNRHLRPMIRSRMRLMGRFIMTIKDLDPSITALYDVIMPTQFDNIVMAIKDVADFNEGNGRFAKPSTAFALGTELKKATRIAISESIKEENFLKKKAAKDLLQLLEYDLDTAINKAVMESQLQIRRTKNVELPQNSDVQKLASYLMINKMGRLNSIREEYSFEKWKALAGYTLIWVQVFNRRRAGEMERVLLEDYRTYQGLDKVRDADILQCLSKEMVAHAENYVCFVIRGKLGRGVSVLLHKEDVRCIDMILKFRVEAGVPEKNPYVFGIPGSTSYTHLRAVDLIREYSVLCNAKNPFLLRGTLLRKHIATQAAAQEWGTENIKGLKDHLGHSEKVHNDYYRLPVVAKQIIEMSELLERAQRSMEKEAGPSTEVSRSSTESFEPPKEKRKSSKGNK